MLFITKIRKYENTKKVLGLYFVFSLFRAFVMQMDGFPIAEKIVYNSPIRVCKFLNNSIIFRVNPKIIFLWTTLA